MALFPFDFIYTFILQRPRLLHLRTLGQSQQTLQIHTLGPLNRQAQRPIPDQLRQRPQPARDAKRGGVVERLVEAVVMEEDAGTAIHVREGVLGLTVAGQHHGRDLAVALHEPEERVAGDFRAGGGEVHEGLEARVRFAEDGVAVAGYHLARVQGRPEVAFDGGVGEGGADLRLHF